jgi:hypothetical protein
MARGGPADSAFVETIAASELRLHPVPKNAHLRPEIGLLHFD